MLHMKRLYSWTKVLSNSSFQFDRIALCGDVHPQPGPAGKLKYPCKECQRNVCSNQNAILCANCETWSHAKCLGLTNTQFKHYLDNSHIDWICNWCCLPFCNHSDLGFNAESNISNDFEISAIIQDQEGEYANILPTDGERPHNNNSAQSMAQCSTEGGLEEHNSDNVHLESLRNHLKNDVLVCHININSIQNKLEELENIINKINAHITFVSETKIDKSYPDRQFSIPGFRMYRNDRKKGGGGVMVYISSKLTCKRLALEKSYKTIEPIAIDIRIDNRNMVILGIYRPPTVLSGDYQTQLENELSDICNWANLKSNFVTLLVT